MSNTHHDRAKLRRLLELLELRESEGLTFKELARCSGVPIHVLNHRASVDRKARQAKREGTSGFIEIVSNGTESLGPDLSGVELVLPGGLRI